MPLASLIKVVEEYILVDERSYASHLCHSTIKSPSSPSTSGIAVAQTGGCGTSLVGVAGPNGWLGTPYLPSLYSTTTTASYDNPSTKGCPCAV